MKLVQKTISIFIYQYVYTKFELEIIYYIIDIFICKCVVVVFCFFFQFCTSMFVSTLPLKYTFYFLLHCCIVSCMLVIVLHVLFLKTNPCQSLDYIICGIYFVM